MDREAKQFISLEIFKKRLEKLTASEKNEVVEEIKYRDSLGWRS